MLPKTDSELKLVKQLRIVYFTTNSNIIITIWWNIDIYVERTNLTNPKIQDKYIENSKTTKHIFYIFYALAKINNFGLFKIDNVFLTKLM